VNMNEENMLKLYETLDEAVQTLQKEISEPYLDSLGNSMEMLFFNDIQQEISPTIKSEVRQVLEKIHLDDYSNEEIRRARSEEHTSELQSRFDLVCRLLLEKKKKKKCKQNK